MSFKVETIFNVTDKQEWSQRGSDLMSRDKGGDGDVQANESILKLFI